MPKEPALSAAPITDEMIVEGLDLMCGLGGQPKMSAQRAAEFLCITRMTLYRRMKLMGYKSVKALRADHSRRGARLKRADPNAAPAVVIPDLPTAPTPRKSKGAPRRAKKPATAVPRTRRPRINPGFANLELDGTGVVMPAETVRLLTGNLIDVIQKEAKAHPDSRLMVCTGGISIPHAERLARIKVADLRIIVDAGILRTAAHGVDRGRGGKRADAGFGKIAKLRAIFGDRIRFVENHIKAVVFAAPDPKDSTAILTSANLNPNKNEEQIETASGLAPHLERMFDDVFEGMSDELSDVDAVKGEASRAGKLLASISLATSMKCITASQGNFIDGFFTAPGMIDFLNEAVKGRTGLTVSISTWGITWRAVYELHRLKQSGVIGKLTLIIAPKLSTAKSVETRRAYAAVMDLIPDDVVWSSTHAKLVVVTGNGRAVVATGTANYTRATKMLNVIRVQESIAAVSAAQALVCDLRSECDPHPPAQADIESVRSLVQKASRTVSASARAAIGGSPQEMVPVQNLAVDYDLIVGAHPNISVEELDTLCRGALKGLDIDASANYAGVNPRRFRTALKAWERNRTESADYHIGRAFYGHAANLEYAVKEALLRQVTLGDTRAAALVLESMDAMPAIRDDENPTTVADVGTMKAARARMKAARAVKEEEALTVQVGSNG